MEPPQTIRSDNISNETRQNSSMLGNYYTAESPFELVADNIKSDLEILRYHVK